MSFTCRRCQTWKDLGQLADVSCICSLCVQCCESYYGTAVATFLKQQASKPKPLFVKEEQVWYVKGNLLCEARVVGVDLYVTPPAYEVMLVGSMRSRFTEESYLRKKDNRRPEPPVLPLMSCPTCQQGVTYRELRCICPRVAELLEEGLTRAYMERHDIIHCPNPGCGAPIERVSGSNGSAGGSADEDPFMQQHRYRCGLCQKDFCDACQAMPYHRGETCEEHRSPPCLFCDKKLVQVLRMEAGIIEGLSVGQLRSSIREYLQEVPSWCLERQDLVKLCKRCVNICDGVPCRHQFTLSCNRLLPCGHWCCGMRGDNCLPCLEEECIHHLPAAERAKVNSGLCMFCFDSLKRGISIQLTCGHLCHLSCAQERLKVGYPGPEISFGFLDCPYCGSEEGRGGNVQASSRDVHMNHGALQEQVDKVLGLREAVVALGKRRLKIEGLVGDAELQPGGKYDGRPGDYALRKFLFFECFQCHRPYFGGMRNCGAAAEMGEGGGGYKKEELVCGECCAIQAGQAGTCPRHGGEFIEWKCRYCCSVASWFCWGNTHMCHRCHERSEVRHGHQCDPMTCHLTRPHPPPGTEFCLGCGLCWRDDR